MGAWGWESCSSDACWDLLGAGGMDDIHEPTQEETDNCIEHVLNEEDDSDFYPEARLGVFVWLLDKGMTIKVEHLKIALSWVENFIEKFDHQEDDERKLEAFKVEEALIQAAIKNNGKGTPRHVKGLLEQMLGG